MYVFLLIVCLALCLSELALTIPSRLSECYQAQHLQWPYFILFYTDGIISLF